MRCSEALLFPPINQLRHFVQYVAVFDLGGRRMRTNTFAIFWKLLQRKLSAFVAVELSQRADSDAPHFRKSKDEPTEKNVIHQIFGGKLRSQVKCALCGHESNVFDPFLDLSLELKGCNSLEKALHAFTAPETLDEENKYLCEK